MHKALVVRRLILFRPSVPTVVVASDTAYRLGKTA